MYNSELSATKKEGGTTLCHFAMLLLQTATKWVVFRLAEHQLPVLFGYFFLLIALCKNIFTKFTSETWAEPRWEPWDGVRVPTQIILISDSLLFFFYQQLVKKMSLKQKSSSTFYWHKRRIFATTYLLPYSLFIRIPKDYGDGICMHAHHVLHQVLCKMDHWDYL